MVTYNIYILLSIKTRIETLDYAGKEIWVYLFISYYPLKQGLKPTSDIPISGGISEFISYYPLKQGLKPRYS